MSLNDKIQYYLPLGCCSTDRVNTRRFLIPIQTIKNNKILVEKLKKESR